MGSEAKKVKTGGTEDIEETELNLELSLGIQFGVVDPKKSKLMASSSMAPNSSSSMPMKIKEEGENELESGLTIGAKRKRSKEGQSNFRENKDGVILEGNCEEDKQTSEAEEEKDGDMKSKEEMDRLWKSGGFPYILPYWTPPYRDAAFARCVQQWTKEKTNVFHGGKSATLSRFPPLLPQGSLGPQGSNSSVISELEDEPPIQAIGEPLEKANPVKVENPDLWEEDFGEE